MTSPTATVGSLVWETLLTGDPLSRSPSTVSIKIGTEEILLTGVCAVKCVTETSVGYSDSSVSVNDGSSPVSLDKDPPGPIPLTTVVTRTFR